MIRPIAAILASFFLAFAETSSRAEMVFTANLTHDQEVANGPLLTTGLDTRPLSFGMARFVLNDAETQLTFSATITNIDFTGTQTPDTNDNLTNAHIHAGPLASPTTTAPVVWGFFGSPFNDNTPIDLVVTPFSLGTGLVGGTVSGKWDSLEGNGTTLAAQLGNIKSGHAYINFHTLQFGGGEIRGFLTPVPEPTSLALLGLGGLACLARRRFRRYGV